MSDLVKRLRFRVEFVNEGHGNVGELSDALCVEAADRIEELEAALRLAEKADDQHINCLECEGEGSAEQCGECFPLADAARLTRWRVLGIGTAKILKFRPALAGTNEMEGK